MESNYGVELEVVNFVASCTLTIPAMYQVSLQFASVTDICRFLKTAELNNFLLLGKKSVLVARFTETAIKMAKEKFHAEVVDNPEFRQLAKIYFGRPVALCD